MTPFDGLTYFEVDYASIPSGWSNQEKRDSRKRVNRGVGRQNEQRDTILNTIHRPNVPTLFDEDGLITQTAERAMYRLDATDYLDEDDLIDAIAFEIADELGKTVNAVKLKVDINVIGDQYDVQDRIANNAADWGEVVA